MTVNCMILCGKLTSYEYNSENRDTKPDIRKFHRFTQTSTTQRSKLHSLGLMLYKINLAIPFEGSRPKYMFFWYYLQCFILTLKNCKYILFYQKCVHLEENTSIYCSRIIVLHVHAIVFFLKFTQCATILQTLSNQEVTLTRPIRQNYIPRRRVI